MHPERVRCLPRLCVACTLSFMSHGRTVAQNAMWLLLATVAQKAISFLTFTIAARLVGVGVTGRYFFAVSITSIFVALADLGLTPVVIREMASDDARGRAFFRKALFAKAVLVPAAILATLLYAGWAVEIHETMIAIVLACFVLSADALSLLGYGFLRGKRQLRFEAFGMFFGQILTAVIALLSAVVFQGGAPGLVAALCVGSLWNLGWSLWHVHRLKEDPLKILSVSWLDVARAAWPFALAGIFVKVYSFIDTLILRQTHGEIAVGWYAVAYKVTYALQFMPLTFVAALYPGMSAAYAAKDRAGLEQMFFGSLRLMLVVGVPLSAALSALAPGLVPFLYGDSFLGSVAPLRILPWVLMPLFLDFPIGSLLNATHRAAQKTLAMGIAMVCNAALNILLVPRWGSVGAAAAAVGSFWVLFLVGVWLTRRDVVQRISLFWLFVRGLIVAVALWFILHTLLPIVPFVVLALVSPFIALILLIATRLMGWQEARLVIGWMRRRASDSRTQTENHAA